MRGIAPEIPDRAAEVRYVRRHDAEDPPRLHDPVEEFEHVHDLHQGKVLDDVRGKTSVKPVVAPAQVAHEIHLRYVESILDGRSAEFLVDFHPATFDPPLFQEPKEKPLPAPQIQDPSRPVGLKNIDETPEEPFGDLFAPGIPNVEDVFHTPPASVVRHYPDRKLIVRLLDSKAHCPAESLPTTHSSSDCTSISHGGDAG
jgi:hypothetical protein